MLQDAWTMLGAVTAIWANDPAVSCGSAQMSSFSPFPLRTTESAQQQLQVVILSADLAQKSKEYPERFFCRHQVLRPWFSSIVQIARSEFWEEKLSLSWCCAPGCSACLSTVERQGTGFPVVSGFKRSILSREKGECTGDKGLFLMQARSSGLILRKSLGPF
jgi:hypothetical protein